MSTTDEILAKSLQQRGINQQLTKMMEECAELIVALSHYIENRPNSILEILEEGSHVELCIQQLKTILNGIPLIDMPHDWIYEQQKALAKMESKLQ